MILSSLRMLLWERRGIGFCQGKQVPAQFYKQETVLEEMGPDSGAGKQASPDLDWLKDHTICYLNFCQLLIKNFRHK